LERPKGRLIDPKVSRQLSVRDAEDKKAAKIFFLPEAWNNFLLESPGEFNLATRLHLDDDRSCEHIAFPRHLRPARIWPFA
jgi:hypothetical protein